MSDFLISIGSKYTAQDLLALLIQPYNDNDKKGKSFSYPWGSMAILEEHIAKNENIIIKDDSVAFWIGDLVTNEPKRLINELIKTVTKITYDNIKDPILSNDNVFCKLNGAFTIIVANHQGFWVITDPMNFVQTYVGNDKGKESICVGSHPDIVSLVADSDLYLDLVSISEFILRGTPLFPYTMYKNVKEFRPGCVSFIRINNNKTTIKEISYWNPPTEIKYPYDENSMVKRLKEILINAVNRRCTGQRIGVKLSGGLDSRFILSVVPKDKECIGVTFCDHHNRETKIAKKVAHCYGREWKPIFRGDKFLADCLIKTVQLHGCEFDFLNAHAIGIEKEISDLNLDSLLDGLEMDAYLKGYHATDWLCQKRLKGLLADRYIKISDDYNNLVSDIDNKIFIREIIDNQVIRRKQSFSKNIYSKRGSAKEWLTLYPFSQNSIGACWASERRIIPLKLIATDRELLDFIFSCPIELKLGNRIFIKSTYDLYGKGAKIPSSNDGVRPGSRHIWRLAQRAIHKSQNRIINITKNIRKDTKVEHCWHDYQKCWKNNIAVRDLIRKYSRNLEQFEGILFKEKSKYLLENKDIGWKYGFRLLQLAVWLNIVHKYRNI